jgi:hypothetical protein
MVDQCKYIIAFKPSKSKDFYYAAMMIRTSGPVWHLATTPVEPTVDSTSKGTAKGAKVAKKEFGRMAKINPELRRALDT